MEDLNAQDKLVYKTIAKLLEVSPDGELTYLPVLAGYLSGKGHASIPWSAINGSALFGSLPKATVISVLLSCKALQENGYLEKRTVNGSNKYFLTSKRLPIEEEPTSFLERLNSYKKYLLDEFKDYILHYCNGLCTDVQDNFFGFKNVVHRRGLEYYWFWIKNTNPVTGNSLQLYLRPRPSSKTGVQSFLLSQDTFDDVIYEVSERLKEAADWYSLKFNDDYPKPNIHGPSKTVSGQISQPLKPILFNLFAPEEAYDVFVNDGGPLSMDAALSTSESSPFKFAGDTKFCPIQTRTLVKGSAFSFSFKKWKLVAWSTLKSSPVFTQNVLIVSKKTKALWMVLSISKKKVLCLSKRPFEVELNGSRYSGEQLLKMLFGDD